MLNSFLLNPVIRGRIDDGSQSDEGHAQAEGYQPLSRLNAMSAALMCRDRRFEY